MAYDLGTVKGSISIDIAQAVAAYAALRRDNAATDTALLESSRSLKAVGAGLAGIGVVALAGFGIAVKAAADFQAKMRYFQVVTGSSKKDMQDATKEAFKLAQTSGYTAGEIADAFVELGKAGINAKSIVAGVGDAVAQLGAAAQIPLLDASQIIVNTMKTFQLGAGQATDIANQLAGAANASTVDITDLAYSLRYVGGTAASLGVPLHDVLDALGQLGNAGIRGSTGGTALRKILLQLAPTTKQATTELEKLGIIQTNGGVSAEAYTKLQTKQKTAIDELRKAQSRLIEIQRIQQANQAAGTGGSSLASQQAAADRLRSAEERLSAAQEHLNLEQQKYASSPLKKTAAQQASMFYSLQSAQDRVAAAQQHLTETQQKNAQAAAGGGKSAASQIRAAYELKNAQDAVTAAALKAKAAGVAVAPGVEKLTNLFFTQAGKAKPLSEIFQILQEHMKGLTQQQKVQAAELIFGNRAISSALILSRQGAKGFQEFGKQMDQTSAADVMRKRLDTLAGAWKVFKGAMSVALIQAGAPAQTPLKILVQLLTRVVEVFTHLPGPVQAALSGLVLLFGVLTGGLGSFILLVGFIGKATRAWREFKTAMLFVKEVQLVQRAFALLNITMLANPVILIVAAIVALIAIFVILIIKVKPVREFFIALGRDILGAFEAVVRFFQRLPSFFVGVWSRIKGLFEDGVRFIEKYWWLLPGIFLGPIAGVIAIIIHFRTQLLKIVQLVVRDVIKFFTRLPSELGKAIVAGAKWFLKFLADFPNQVAYWLGFVIGRFIKFEIDGVQIFARFAVDAFKAIIGFFQRLPGETVTLFTAMLNGIKRIGEEIIGAAKFIGKQFVHFIVWYYTKLPVDIYNILKRVLGYVARFFEDIYKTAVKWASIAVTDVINFFKNLPDNIAKFLSAMWKNVIDLGSKIIGAMDDIGSGAVGGIMSFFTGLPDLIYHALLNAIGSIKNLAGKAFDTAKHWGSSLWGGFKHGLGIKSPSYIEKAMFQITATTEAETKKIARHMDMLNRLATTIATNRAVNSQLGLGRLPAGVSQTETQAATGGAKIYQIEINNPTPEPASESVPRVLRNLDFVGAI